MKRVFLLTYLLIICALFTAADAQTKKTEYGRRYFGTMG